MKIKCDLALKQEDDSDYGYPVLTPLYWAENDISMANEGHIFEVGELDFYLDEILPAYIKDRIRRIKEEQGV